MASTNPISADDIKRLRSDGLLDIKDSGVGERVQRMQDERYPVRRAEGLIFCKQNVLDDTRVRQVLETCFDWCGLGIYKVFADRTRDFVFMNCPNTEMSALNVHLWEAGSQITYYIGSQFLELDTLESSTGLLEVTGGLEGSKPEVVEMEHGGIVITDARVVFRIMKGLAIMFTFATKEELAEWGKMELKKGRGLEPIVDSMKRLNVGVNFKFVD